MPWPNRIDYMEAVRDYPNVSLQDPHLSDGIPKKSKDGSTISYSGGFSIVFPIKTASKTFALRCWLKDVKNVETRYKKTSDYLKHICLPYFVDFEYVPRGILIDGEKYPITRMQWAEGVPLREFITQNIRNSKIFETAASEFRKMVNKLHDHKIAHGDLQDGNILLNKLNGTDVNIKLIDYDSLFVPTLQDEPDQIIGLPEYQHPMRMQGGRQANEKVDYFSELVIYLSFLSLAEKPDLWDQFKDKTEKGLLFSKADFENCENSRAFQVLEGMSSKIKLLVSALKEFCQATSIDQLVPLEVISLRTDSIAHYQENQDIYKVDESAGAINASKKAVSSSDANTHYEQGISFLHSDRYEKAIDAFEKARNINPNSKEVLHGLSLAYQGSGNKIDAQKAATEALEIDPTYRPSRVFLRSIDRSFFTSSDMIFTSSDMIKIPEGEYFMGGIVYPDEEPIHKVYIDAFNINIHEVTNHQYKKFVDDNPEWQKAYIPEEYHDGNYLRNWVENNYPNGKEKHPVTNVSWYAAMAYAEWIGKRLPTEAEWEKAARSNLQGKTYPWGNSIDNSKANFSMEVMDTTPVGNYPANGFGLYDMAGNVWEWCLDEYDREFYSSSPYHNPVAGKSLDYLISNFKNIETSRVSRGGAWVMNRRGLRVATRRAFNPKRTDSITGFRCVKSITI